MNRSWISAALPCLALAIIGWPDDASAVDPDRLAAPGACATELRALRLGPIGSQAATGSAETSSAPGDSQASTSGWPEGSAATGPSTTIGSAAGGTAGGGQTTTGAPRVHLTPIEVALAPPRFTAQRPLPRTFTGPGPCDQPGSGCQGRVLPAATTPAFVDPAPTGGCDFPGCKP